MVVFALYETHYSFGEALARIFLYTCALVFIKGFYRERSKIRSSSPVKSAKGIAV